MIIKNIAPLENMTLLISAENGDTGIFDVKPYLTSLAFAPLKNHHEFSKIHNGGYYIEWACGADLSADTIESHWIMTDVA